MPDTTKCKDGSCGVACDVYACKYCGDDCLCHADSIKVESPGACCKSDTFCSTFSNKETL